MEHEGKIEDVDRCERENNDMLYEDKLSCENVTYPAVCEPQ